MSDPTVQVLILMNQLNLITEIQEVLVDFGEPNCRLIKPYLISDDGTEKGRLYSDPRVFSIYELLIISSLPHNWDIPDWANESFVRKVIGEGIPPLLRP